MSKQMYTYQGVTKHISAWAKDKGVYPSTMGRMIARLGIEKAMVTPVNNIFSERDRIEKFMKEHPGLDADVVAYRLQLTKGCVQKHMRDIEAEGNKHIDELMDDFNFRRIQCR